MGQAAMPGYAGGAFFAIFDGERFDRKAWTAVHGGAVARLKSVDMWGRSAVLVHEHVAKQGAPEVEGAMVSHESFFDRPPGGSSDVHITVIPVAQSR